MLGSLLSQRLVTRFASLNRTMSTASIVPHDPTSQSSDIGKLWSLAVADGEKKVGTTRIFYDTPQNSGKITAITSLGEKFGETKGNKRRELVRKAVGSAVKDIKGLGLGEGCVDVQVDANIDAHAAAVAAHLASYKFTLKTSPPSSFKPDLKESIPDRLRFSPVETSKEWDTGVFYAKSQNLARTLTELPANMMTPTAFTERVRKEFAGIPNVEIIVRDEAWAAEKGMHTFLSVTQGTSEPAKFLEILYKNADASSRPIVFVGKGVTFDSGGISLKPSANMKRMRGDMGGAAAVVSSALAIAQLQLPVNLIVLTPLCENLPGPSATKPGDIIYAMNGQSVEVDNTDAEGRLILSDTLYYGSTTFKPRVLVDVATLTGAMGIALGEVYSGVFSTSDDLWTQLHAAGETEHDRFWRMPLDEEYGPQIHKSNADLCNTGGRPAGSCTAALFLKAFVDGIEPKDGTEPPLKWAHIDMAGSMDATRSTPYQEIGMTGRPVRALIEFVRSLCA